MPPVASTTARARTAPTPSRWPSPITCSVSPATAPSGVAQQVEHERVLDHLDAGGVEHAGDERPLDLGAGGVAAGVRDAVAVVTALAGQRQLAVERRGRSARPSGPARAPPPGPRARAPAPPPRRTRRRRRRSCRRSAGRASRSAPSAAAMPPCAQRVDPAASTSLVTSSTRSDDCRGDVQRGGQPGDARADDDDVGVDRPARLGGGQPAAAAPSQVDRDVVDQPGRADPGRDEQPGRRRAPGSRRGRRRAARGSRRRRRARRPARRWPR